MAEELAKYFTKVAIRCRYIHSDVETLERVEIMQDLRKGIFDVLIGVNLLREGLDLPEVSLVAILDADKEGFLRSHRSLTQTVGRAARNVNGLAILYADRMTDSMQKTIDETNRRREIQMQYNKDHGKVPTPLNKKITQLSMASASFEENPYEQKSLVNQAAEINENYSTEDKDKLVQKLQKEMEKAAKNLDFIKAAELRDQIQLLTQEN